MKGIALGCSVIAILLISCSWEEKRAEEKPTMGDTGVQLTTSDAGISCQRLTPDLKGAEMPLVLVSPPPEHCSHAAIANVSNGRVSVSVCESRIGRNIFAELAEGDRPTAYATPNFFFKGYVRNVPKEVSGLWGALEVEVFSTKGIYDIVYFDFEGVSSDDLAVVVDKVLTAPIYALDAKRAAEKVRCRERSRTDLRIDVGVIRRALFER
jgi:hypothetical protein